MNILLTNDDGINSEGLKKLENILKEYGNVFVVAPEVEQSGKACSTNSFNNTFFSALIVVLPPCFFCSLQNDTIKTAATFVDNFLKGLRKL